MTRGELLKLKLERELARLDATIADMEARGVQSMTISTGDGQKSCTRMQLKDLLARRADVQRSLVRINRRLLGLSSFAVTHIMTLRH